MTGLEIAWAAFVTICIIGGIVGEALEGRLLTFVTGK